MYGSGESHSHRTELLAEPAVTAVLPSDENLEYTKAREYTYKFSNTKVGYFCVYRQLSILSHYEQDNYVLSIRGNHVYYNEVNSSIKLTKRRKQQVRRRHCRCIVLIHTQFGAGQDADDAQVTLMVTSREYGDDEIDMQQKRMAVLRNDKVRHYYCGCMQC